MGQEGPCQPHPNHKEEADKDKARLHSWRGSEKKEAKDRPWRRGGTLPREICSHVSSWNLQEREWELRNGTRERSWVLQRGASGNASKVLRELWGLSKRGILHKSWV